MSDDNSFTLDMARCSNGIYVVKLLVDNQETDSINLMIN